MSSRGESKHIIESLLSKFTASVKRFSQGVDAGLIKPPSIISTANSEQNRVEELMSQFPRGVRLTIDVIFPSEYKVGWKEGKYIYVPGLGSYYPLEEALEKALAAYREFQSRKADEETEVRKKGEGSRWQT